MFPIQRPRRLRRSPIIRDLVRETVLTRDDLIYPLFIRECGGKAEPITTMPGQMRHTLDSLPGAIESTVKTGIKAVMLFGIPSTKDPMGSRAYADDGVIQRSVRSIKERGFPVSVITDVCMCEYTSHGHCGMIKDGDVDNDSSLELLVRTAVSQARSGADMIAPSDMMDGRIGAIRKGLDDAGFQNTAIMSYAVKYASAFYGPFRDAAGSAPAFGDRRTYQMDPANRREALREARMDIEEGADIVMVKPALAYLDIISEVRKISDVPVAAYNVSGEYAMIESASKAGCLDRERAIIEILTSIKRAGADLILTYHAPDALKLLD